MSVGQVIVPRAHDIGGFEVRRALPATERQMIGPFIFFDQMGPGEFLTGRGLDVRRYSTHKRLKADGASIATAWAPTSRSCRET
jgi:redox-sensitive bicupin YhaK (pirin superfamily)